MSLQFLATIFYIQTYITPVTSTHSPVTYTTRSLMRIHALGQLLSHMTSHCFLIRSVAAHLLTRPPKGGSASIVLYFTLRWCSLLEVLSLVETIVFHNRYVHTYTQCKCTFYNHIQKIMLSMYVCIHAGYTQNQ